MPYSRQFPSRDHTRTQRQTTFALVLGLMAISVLLYLTRLPDLSSRRAVLGILIIWLGSFPWILFTHNYGSGPVPLVPAIGLFYAVSFGLPVFLDFTSLPGITWVSKCNDPALFTVLIGLCCFYGSYYVCWHVLLRQTKPLSLRLPQSDGGLTQALWLFILIHLADLYIHWASTLSSIRYLAEAGALVAYGYLSFRALTRNLPKLQKQLLTGALMLETLARITSGSLAQPMQLGLLLGFVYWIARRRFPWVPLLISVPILLELHNVKDKYRELAWFDGTLANASQTVKIQRFAELAFDNANSIDSPQSGLLSNSLALRASQLGFLSHVVELTPDIVPYLHGETYKILPSKIIPRMFWPDKPTETMGQDFSRRYGMRDPHDETTSFNVPWLIEMFANFGDVGVAIGMALIGAGFAVLDRKLNAPEMAPLDRIVGVVLMFDLIYQESNFSLMVGNKLLIYFAFRILFQILQHRNDGRTRRLGAFRPEGLTALRPSEPA